LILAQTLDELILCSNTVHEVRQKQILIAIQKTTETAGAKGRLVALRDSLNTEHLNIEERESLIFHLEGDPLTCTDTVFS